MFFRGMVGAFYESYMQHTNTSFIKFQRFLKTELGCKGLRLFVRFMSPFGFISGYQRLGETCCLCFPQSRWVTAGSSETLAADTKSNDCNLKFWSCGNPSNSITKVRHDFQTSLLTLWRLKLIKKIIFFTLEIIHYASIRKTKFKSCSSRIKIKGMPTLRLRSPSVRQSVKQHLSQRPDFQGIRCRNYLQNAVEQVCVLWKIVHILKVKQCLYRTGVAQRVAGS